MAGNTVTTLASLQCPHGGTVTIVSSNTQVQAAGGSLALMNDTYTIVGCPFTIPATPPIPSPCVSIQWVVPDVSVKVNGQPTISQTSTGLCLNAQQIPQGPVVVQSTQPLVSTE